MDDELELGDQACDRLYGGSSPRPWGTHYPQPVVSKQKNKVVEIHRKPAARVVVMAASRLPVLDEN